MTSTAKSHEQNEGTMNRVVKFISKFGKMVFLSIIKKKNNIYDYVRINISFLTQ